MRIAQQRRVTKVELGSGERPTPGYLSTDVTAPNGVELDCISPAWELSLPDGTVSEVLALGVVEHFTFTQAALTFANVYRMLEPGGEFLFDVPDLVVWCRYLTDLHDGKPVPFTREHILATLYGWQRWPGDEHKSGWDAGRLTSELGEAGFETVEWGVEQFVGRVLLRARMTRPEDAHIYCRAVK